MRTRATITKAGRRLRRAVRKLGANVGIAEIGRAKWLAETFDQQKIKYPRTEKGNPSFPAGTAGWMAKHPHWLPQLIVKADKYNNAAVNFLETYILGHVIRGRVHAEIHPPTAPTKAAPARCASPIQTRRCN